MGIGEVAEEEGEGEEEEEGMLMESLWSCVAITHDEAQVSKGRFSAVRLGSVMWTVMWAGGLLDVAISNERVVIPFSSVLRDISSVVSSVFLDL